MLDLKHRCHQMPLHEDSRPGTAVSTPPGAMQWKVVPMGAKNENAAFHHIMEDFLRLVRDCADLFVDDIIIVSGTEDMTDEKLIAVHARDKHSMVCKPKKATPFVREVQGAGHEVGQGQRRPMPGKVAILRCWEKAKTISEFRAVMRFCNYYTGYVQMYADLSGPLGKMLQVGKFDGRERSKKKLAWTTEAAQ